MTKITISHKNNRYKFTFKGHADSNDYGKDIVCSSISTLAYILHYYKEHRAKAFDDVFIKEGYTEAIFYDVNENEDVFFRALIDYFKSLELTFGDYVKLNIVESDKQ